MDDRQLVALMAAIIFASPDMEALEDTARAKDAVELAQRILRLSTNTTRVKIAGPNNA